MLSHNSRMSRQRGRTDAVEISREPRWLVVRVRLSRALEYRAGGRIGCAHGHGRETTELAAARWRVDSIPKNYGFYFADRDNDRVYVAIECFEPVSNSSLERGS